MPHSDDPFLLNSSPSSSPPSSPSFGPIDSSPPSSPSVGPISTPPASPRLSHPFAASTKATRRPHLYEKGGRSLRWASNASPERGFEARDDDSTEHNKSQASRPPVRRRFVESLGAVGGGPQLLHPYAASAKSSWKPPRQERKMSRVVSDVSWAFGSGAVEPDEDGDSTRRTMPRATSVDTLEGSSLFDEEDALEAPSRVVTREEREWELWDQRITAAFDDGNGIIVVGAPGPFKDPLHSIPPFITDINKLVVLPTPESASASVPSTRVFARAATEPLSDVPFFASGSGRGALTLGKAASFAGLKTTAEPPLNEIQLHLENNVISTLPPQLFFLGGLTVLDLHGNRLSNIPPQIVHLNNLRNLNLAQNNLCWLPAEMLQMRLDQLSVYPNPWMVPSTQDVGSQTRHLTPTTVHFTLPGLNECCLRQLLAPASQDAQPAHELTTYIEAMYGCPLPGADRLPPALLQTLRACIPWAMAEPDATSQSPSKVLRRGAAGDVHSQRGRTQRRAEVCPSDVETHPGISVCPSPDHNATSGRVPVYVEWAEERFTWESVVAGRSVSSLGGPGVPMRWRGCGRGCLDFLDTDAPVEKEEDVVPDTDVEMGDHSGDEGVQLLDLGGGGLANVDAEEFE
ncbi:hypothetical protein B0H21DRAFT_752593 [Amylocystis lapponica]|nr:hypothetical protein B0H21DRAFT_752593 [Amylocystis lapponica]